VTNTVISDESTNYTPDEWRRIVSEFERGVDRGVKGTHELEVRPLQMALRHIIAMAGNPDAAEACRLIINRAKQALGEK